MKREVMEGHDGHGQCVCTDGRRAERDISRMCDSPIIDYTPEENAEIEARYQRSQTS